MTDRIGIHAIGGKDIWKDVCLSFLAVVMTLFLLRGFLSSGAYHSSNLDQQFLIPPMLHGIHMAWIGEGSFFFNFTTGEPIWGNPNYSPFYPFYGSITVLAFDVFGVEDYTIIGNYISVFHRLILSLSCYYFFRTLSASKLTAICFAVFVASSEAIRIPSNWYMALSALSWVPFMLGACVDIYFSRFVRGTFVLIVTTVLSVLAAPVYLGLGVAIIPCGVVLCLFLFRFVVDYRQLSDPSLQASKRNQIALLFLSALSLLFLLMPVLYSAYVESEDLVRWLRTGPVVGRSLSVGNELFYETQDFGYLKRLVTDFGTRGIFSSYYLGGVVALFFFCSPVIWLITGKSRANGWLAIRLCLWFLAIVHLGFVFGEKLIFPKILYIVPVVNAFRHLSAFGSIFIILASVCAFDAIRLLFEEEFMKALRTAFSKKHFGLKMIVAIAFFAFCSLIFTYSIHSVAVTLVIFVVAFFVLMRSFQPQSPSFRNIIASVSIAMIAIMGVWQQQSTRFNVPLKVERYKVEVDELDTIFDEVSTVGEVVNSKLSGNYSGPNKLNGMQIQSYLSTKNYRVALSYLSPRHHARFTAGVQAWNGEVDIMRQAGVTLLVADKAEVSKPYLQDASVLKSTEHFVLLRLQPNALERNMGICITDNICGDQSGDDIDLNLFAYPELKFKTDTASLYFEVSPKSPSLTRVFQAGNKEVKVSYRPNTLWPSTLIAFLGLLLSIVAISRLKDISRSSDSAYLKASILKRS